MTKTNLDHLAKLANLPLNDTEKREFSRELPDILKYVDHIQTLKLGNLPQTSQVTGKVNELRLDKIDTPLTQKEALSQAKESYQGYFVVPAVFND